MDKFGVGLVLAVPGSHTLTVGPDPSPTLHAAESFWVAPRTGTVSPCIQDLQPLQVDIYSLSTVLGKFPPSLGFHGKSWLLMPLAWLDHILILEPIRAPVDGSWG